jgi:hypothetical protein
MKQGVKQGTVRGEYKKWTNQEIIDVISKYETLKDLRMSDDKPFYFLALRRGLREHLPVKRTRCMNIVGSALEKKLLAKQEKPVIPVKEKKKPGPKPKEKLVKIPKGVQIYKHTFENGVKICGRCFQNEPKTLRSVLCKDCQIVYVRKYCYEKDHVPYNLKQEYCNTIIKHHEKTFEIGIKVDEKLQNYLTLVGYQFLFQDPWENIWK